MRILVLFCGLTVAMVAMAAADTDSAAEYLGGTVKAIPVNTPGTLDLTDPSYLVFRYGKAAFRLPFGEIKSYELEGPGSGAHRHLGQVPLPRLWPGHEQTLNLSYQTLGSPVGVMSFRLTGKDLKRAEWILNTRIKNAQEASNTGRSKLPEAWWGDRYWKTNRNSGRWGGTEAESGTK